MPDGQTHYRYYMKGYRVTVPVVLLLAGWDWKFSLGYLVGYSLGRYLDPDLDLMGCSSCEGRMVNELPIIGHFLFGSTSAYGSLFRRYHRSFWTHFPGLSTAIRLLFVGFVPFIIGDYFGINFVGDGWHKFWIGLWAGLSQADTIHWYLDKTYGDK